MNYKIAQFILTPPQRSPATLEIFVAQPDANKEALAGKLFALIQIDSAKAENLKIINFLINTVNHNYYLSEKMILRERLKSIRIEHIFESALAKTNKKLAEFLQSEKIRLNPGLLNITIGVIYNDGLHFASLGKNKALLIYKSKAEETAKYKLADISEQTGGEAKRGANLTKLFSNVVSGALPRSGYFLFTNETFAEYLSAKQIIGIITTLPPASAAEQIKNTLSKINLYVPFLGIIIKNTAGLEMAEVKIKEPVAASTNASIENLLVTEEKTEKLLTPAGLVSAKKWLAWFNQLTDRFSFRPAAKPGPTTFALKDKIFAKKKPGWLSPAKIFVFLKSAGSGLIGLIIFLFKIITDKRAMADFFNNLTAAVKNAYLKARLALISFFSWYKNLGRLNKILFSAFIACLLLFSANLGWQAVKNKQLEKELAASNLITLIEQKQNQIDASFLYNNEDGAKKLLDEVKILSGQLPRKNQAQIDQYNVIAAKNQVQRDKISRVIIAEPKEVANFANLNANAKPTSLILAPGKIYAADSAQSAIYSIDLKSQLITTISLNSQNASSLKFPSTDKNNNLYYLDGGRLVVLDLKSEKVSTLSFDYQGDLANAIDLKQYNNRFYLADRGSGQIYRFTKSADKVGASAAWLNRRADLSDATSLDIDGSIYLLNTDGQILKYAKGQAEEFSLAAVEPAFSQAAKVSATAKQNYIYVLEPTAKRLAVFDKTGNFINQYTNDKFNNLIDFQIDEAEQKIYFLNDAAVWLVSLSLPANK